MIPSKAKLKLSKIEGLCLMPERCLARLHRRPVLVAEQVEEPWTSGGRHASPTTCGQRMASPS